MMRRGKEWGILFTECGFILQTADLIEKSTSALEYRSKGQFCKNTVYLERGMPFSCICRHKRSACQEN